MQSTHGQIRAHIYKPFQHLWCLHVIGMSSTSELKTPRVDKNHANHTQWFCSPYSCHSSCLFSFLTQSISNEIRIHKTFVINFLRHLWFSVHIISSFLWITSSRVFPPLISLEVATLDLDSIDPKLDYRTRLRGRKWQDLSCGVSGMEKWWIIGGLISVIFLQESHFKIF